MSPPATHGRHVMRQQNVPTRLPVFAHSFVTNNIVDATQLPLPTEAHTVCKMLLQISALQSHSASAEKSTRQACEYDTRKNIRTGATLLCLLPTPPRLYNQARAGECL